MPNNAQLALIHFARKQLGLDDDDYRTILQSVCKVESAKDIKHNGDVQALMDAFRRLGFDQKKALLNCVVMATDEQKHKIKRIWETVTKNAKVGCSSLDTFLNNRFHVNGIANLTLTRAVAVIEALKQMQVRTFLQHVYGMVIIQDDSAKDAVQNQLLNHFNRVGNQISTATLQAIVAVLLWHGEISLEKLIAVEKLTQEFFRDG